MLGCSCMILYKTSTHLKHKKAMNKAYVPTEYATGTYALFFVFW